ncbi:atp phosphoribosyltransferase [Moniliophthora roreri]|nr:atp phosphoribosyltransferase [Moniliophthora roreri]
MHLITNALDGRVLFAIPKKGRLHEKCLQILAGADIQFRKHARLDLCVALNLPIALVFLPASDIPSFVGKGNIDIGITGHDVILEAEMKEHVTEELRLGFGKCALQAACSLGLADGIESGDTMRAYNLHPIATVLDTEAVLIKSRKNLDEDQEKLIKLITSRIAGVVAANRYAICQYNIPRDKLSLATHITPGRRAPTVSALEEEGWVAVSSMVEKNKIAEIMDELDKIGAQDILTFHLDNCRV